MMISVLLDTDTLSNIMRRHPVALAHAGAYLAIYTRFNISLMTRYEILRGLKAKRAIVQQSAFAQFCATNNILPLTDNIIVRAADIYADLQQRGELIGDADILIAATALEHNFVLITNNTNHFQRIPGLQLQNWLIA